MTPASLWLAGFVALIACGGPAGQRPATADSIAAVQVTDSLVLTSTTGVEIWFTLARAATGVDGKRCVERGLELRQGARRVQVPLLYTGSPPVLIDDTTMRAILWTHCRPGDPYRVNLRSGQPVREPTGATP
jgi:hypothetical protein